MSPLDAVVFVYRFGWLERETHDVSRWLYASLV